MASLPCWDSLLRSRLALPNTAETDSNATTSCRMRSRHRIQQHVHNKKPDDSLISKRPTSRRVDGNRYLGRKAFLAAILLMSFIDRSQASTQPSGPVDWRPEHIVVTDAAYPGYILRLLSYYGQQFLVMQGMPVVQNDFNLLGSGSSLKESNSFALSDGGHLMVCGMLDWAKNNKNRQSPQHPKVRFDYNEPDASWESGTLGEDDEDQRGAPTSTPLVVGENVNGTLYPTYQAMVHIVPHKHRLTFSKAGGNVGFLPENRDPGYMVFASDSDDLILTTNKGANFSIVEGNGNGTFKLVKYTRRRVKIASQVRLDREQKEVHRLVIKAQAGPEVAFVNVTVRVSDENDNQPTSAQSSYEFRVRADSVPQTVVGQVEGKDADGDQLVFKLVERNSLIAMVPKTGQLVLTRKPLEEWERNSQLTTLAKQESDLKKADLDNDNSDVPVKDVKMTTTESMDTTEDLYVVTLHLKAVLNDTRPDTKLTFSSDPVPITVHIIPPEGRISPDPRIDNYMKYMKDTRDENKLGGEESKHRSRRSTPLGSIRPTKSYKFKETDGSSPNKTVFTLDKKYTGESFELEAANRLVSSFSLWSLGM